MMAYSGGDDLGTIVADIGSHTTKMGFAGEDAPRALFRSDVAVLRSSEHDSPSSTSSSASPANTTNITSTTTSSSASPKRRRRRCENITTNSTTITSIRYDLSRPIDPLTGSDLTYTPANPIDPTTGLLHLSSSSSSHPSLLSPLLQHGLSTSLCHANPSEHPFLMIEKSYNPPYPHRHLITERLFEEFQIPALYLGRDAVMACFACGRTTGVVVDVGATSTTISPVYDGFVEHRGVMRGMVGGKLMDKVALEMLDGLYRQSATTSTATEKEIMPWYRVTSPLSHKPKRNDAFHRLSRWDMACQQKESLACVAGMGYDAGNVDAKYRSMPKNKIELPDGTVVEMGCERYELGELLFGTDDVSMKKREDSATKARKAMVGGTGGSSSSSAGGDGSGDAGGAGAGAGGLDEGLFMGEISSATVQNMICDAAFKCDRDQQAQLLGNVVLSGGGTCMAGLPDRLRDEVEAIIHTHTPGWRVKVLAPAPPERAVCSWLGGSILASLGSFHDMWMTKAEYEEHGAVFVNRKCP